MSDHRAITHTAVSAILGWTGTAASLLMTHANAIGGLIAALFACVVSYYGIRVAQATLRVRSIEERRAALEREQAEAELCRECIDGYPPEKCPKSWTAYPVRCPKRHATP